MSAGKVALCPANIACIAALISLIAGSGPRSGNVGNSMRLSISGGDDEITTAVLVPPISTPAQSR
jgi:hypothetical protein